MERYLWWTGHRRNEISNDRLSMQNIPEPTPLQVSALHGFIGFQDAVDLGQNEELTMDKKMLTK